MRCNEIFTCQFIAHCLRQSICSMFVELNRNEFDGRLSPPPYGRVKEKEKEI